MKSLGEKGVLSFGVAGLLAGVVLVGCSASDGQEHDGSPVAFEHTVTISEPGFSAKPGWEAVKFESTVVVPDGRDLVAYAVPSGDEVWRNSVFPEPYPGGTFQYGVSAPVVHDDGVHATYIVDTDNRFEIVVVDLATGDKRSSAAASKRGTLDVGRAGLLYGDESQVVLVDGRTATSLDVHTGESMWSTISEGDDAHFRSGEHIVLVRAAGNAGSEVVAVDAKTGNDAWVRSTPVETELRYVGKQRVVAVYGNEVAVLNAATGETAGPWGDMNQRLAMHSASVDDCERVSDATIVCGFRPDGVGLAAFDAESGQELWSIFRSPDNINIFEVGVILTVHGDMAYVASSAGSRVLDVRTGATVSSGDWAPVEMLWHAGAVTGFSPDEGGTLHFQKATDWS